jgi:hypothetical protein
MGKLSAIMAPELAESLFGSYQVGHRRLNLSRCTARNAKQRPIAISANVGERHGGQKRDRFIDGLG